MAKLTDLMTATELLEAIRIALAGAGMPRTSSYSGGENLGWVPGNVSRGSGFYVQYVAVWKPLGPPSDPWNKRDYSEDRSVVRIGITVSGKAAGVRYRSYKQYSESAGVMNMHDPVDAEKLFPRIKKVFTDAGLTVVEIKKGGAQQHWDDDIGYTVTVKYPAILKPETVRPW